VFVCPSIYEPLGIVNLEAMACEAAVVATHTGGIPEVVEDGITGLLVPFEPRDDGSREPVDTARFAQELAERVNDLLADPSRAELFGKAGRRRAVEQFSWSAVAAETVVLYQRVLDNSRMAQTAT
jgi:starch synthase